MKPKLSVVTLSELQALVPKRTPDAGLFFQAVTRRPKLLGDMLRENVRAWSEGFSRDEKISLASGSVDASRPKRGGANNRLHGKSKPPMSAPRNDSGIEHPAPTSVSGGDSTKTSNRKSLSPAR